MEFIDKKNFGHKNQISIIEKAVLFQTIILTTLRGKNG
jgi:hypothetical protein